MRVDLSCAGAAVPETLLNDAEVHAHFQQMRGVRVPERMNMSAFGDAGALEGALERLLQAAIRERMDRGSRLQTTRGCGKYPRLRAVRLPEFTEQLESAVRQGDIPVLATLAVNVEDHPSRINVRALKLGAFQQAQSTAIDRFQADRVDRRMHLLQNPVHFLPAQDDGQFLLRPRPDQPQRGPVALECSLIEKLDPTQGDRRRRPRDLPLVGQIQEILSELFFAQLSRSALEV